MSSMRALHVRVFNDNCHIVYSRQTQADLSFIFAPRNSYPNQKHNLRRELRLWIIQSGYLHKLVLEFSCISNSIKVKNLMYEHIRFFVGVKWGFI